jgi:glycine oxidase
MPGTADVIVVGGGVIGLSVSWEAARRGLSVALVDPSPGRGAGWVAAGILSPVSETSGSQPGLARLFCAAADRWPAFAARLEAETGLATGFQTCGSVAVALCASDQEAVDRLLAANHELGRDARALSSSECREAVDVLSPTVSGGALIPGDHQIDNRALLTALVEACTRAGVATVTDRAVALDRDARGAVAGVVTAGGEVLSGGRVVLAAGAWTPEIAGVPEGVLPAVRPVKGHVVRLRAAGSAGSTDSASSAGSAGSAGSSGSGGGGGSFGSGGGGGSSGGRAAFSHVVSGYVHGRHRYLVARVDGSVVVGATVEARGFDTSVQAGALRSLLEDAQLLVPSVDDWEYVECLAGLRPGSPDGGPFVGPLGGEPGSPRVSGLLVATGHYRNGLLLAPITAEAVVECLTTGTVPPPLDAFPADRHLTA